MRVQQGGNGRRVAPARYAVFQLRVPAASGPHGWDGDGQHGPFPASRRGDAPGGRHGPDVPVQRRQRRATGHHHRPPGVYDIMRRLRALYSLDIDLSDLRPRYEEEAQRLQESLDRVAQRNDEARGTSSGCGESTTSCPSRNPSNCHPASREPSPTYWVNSTCPGDDDEGLAGAR